MQLGHPNHPESSDLSYYLPMCWFTSFDFIQCLIALPYLWLGCSQVQGMPLGPFHVVPSTLSEVYIPSAGQMYCMLYWQAFIA